MACNCRRSRGDASAKGFCATLSMATPVTFSTGPQALIDVSSSPLPIREALERHSCGMSQTTGVRLADAVAKLLVRANERDPNGVASLTGKRFPMLTAREKLIALLLKCPVCQGAGCQACEGLGYVTG